MPFHIDDSQWPLLRVVWKGAVSNEEFKAYLRRMDVNLARTTQSRTHTAVLLDGRQATELDSMQRKLQADWIKANEFGCRRHCVGFAFVLNNALLRGALTAILWLSPLPAPHIVCATSLEAEQWLIARLREAGVIVPAAEVALRA